MRPSGRKLDEMRPTSIETGVTKHAEGSCLIRCGDTHVLCTATIEDKAPSFLKGTGLGKAPDGFGGGAGEDQFASFLRQEQARGMVRAGGIGLSETIFQALKRGEQNG